MSLLAEMRAAGLGIRLRDGRLQVSGPAEVKAKLRLVVAEHRSELIAELQAPSRPVKPYDDPEVGPHRWVPCDVCGEWALLARTRRCFLTPKCKGSHRLSNAPRKRTRRSA